MTERQQVVVCGGGAGGLELAVKLALRGDLAVILVDKNPVHLWKPLLHELASGSLDPSEHEVSYLALASRHGFTFAQGALEQLDRGKQVILVGEVTDDDGIAIIPRRHVRYDLLVLAIGGASNDFGVPGVMQHALMLDTPREAEAIRLRIVQQCMAANYATEDARPSRLRIVIVGGGATGVELAAELRSTTRTLISYGLDHLDPETFIEITVLNADPRLLVQLPASVSRAIEATLSELGIAVHNTATVVAVDRRRVNTRDGHDYAADLVIWAAGVRGNDIARSLDELEVSRSGQLMVHPDLRTTRDPSILAFGDCAACPWVTHRGNVPARAQASQQQSTHISRYIGRYLAGDTVPSYQYRDLGSLVSLGPNASAIGTLMGFLTGRSLRVRGFVAGLFYRWLYKRHRAALFGWWPVLLESFSRWSGGLTRPRIKLH